MFLGFHCAGMEVDEYPARNMPPNPHKPLTKQTGGEKRRGRECVFCFYPPPRQSLQGKLKNMSRVF